MDGLVSYELKHGPSVGSLFLMFCKINGNMWLVGFMFDDHKFKMGSFNVDKPYRLWEVEPD